VTLSCEPLPGKAYGRRVADHLTAARADAWPVHARAGRLLMAGLHYRRGLLRSLGVDTATSICPLAAHLESASEGGGVDGGGVVSDHPVGFEAADPT
jgi:hypothetical protein